MKRQPCISTIAIALMPTQDLKVGAGADLVERADDRAVGSDPFVDLDDALVEHRRQDDVAGEDLRPRLVTDARRRNPG